MAKGIKRAGIVFFALVISFLLLIGIFVTFGATFSENSIADLENAVAQPTVDQSYTLTGSLTNMQNTWNAAVQYSYNHSAVNVNVALAKDWDVSSVSNHSFGTGIGFSEGRIHVPWNTQISLDLKGFNINRGLTSETAIENGQVILIGGKLNLMDSKFTGTDLSFADIDKMGKITGGANYAAEEDDTTYGGGIILHRTNDLVGEDGNLGNNTTLNIYCGAIVNNYVYINKGSYKGGGGIYAMNANINIYGGIIANNTAIGSNETSEIKGQGGGIFLIGGTININGGLITKNYAESFGGGIYLESHARILDTYFNFINGVILDNKAGYGAGVALHRGAHGNMQGGKIIGNFATQNAGAVLVYINSQFNMYNGIISDNKVVNTDGRDNNGGGAFYVVSSSSFRMYGGEITNNLFESNGNAFGGAVAISVNSATDEAIFNGGKITNNKVKTNGKDYMEYGAGLRVIARSGSVFKIGANMQINNNKLSNGDDSNLYLYGNTIITISEKFSSDTKIGVSTDRDYTGEFTSGYTSSGNSTSDISKFFFSDEVGANVVLSNNEATFESIRMSKNKPVEKDYYMIYGGEEVSFYPDGFSSDCMSILSNKGIELGDYTAIVKPRGRYLWNDGSTDEVSYNFTIIKDNVFGENSVYDYLVYDNGMRKTYTQAKLYHKYNDDKINIQNNNTRYVIGNINVNTTLKTFIDNLLTENITKVKLFNSNGSLMFDGINIKSDNDNVLVATGWYIEYLNYLNQTEQIYLSVLGDLNGDGRITASDVAEVREVAENSTLLNSMSLEKKLACMVDNKGSVTYVDSEILRNTINNQLDINLFFESGVNIDSEYKYLTLDKDNLIRGTSEAQTNVIGNISVNTSVATFKEKLAVLGIDTTAITIYDRKGIVVTDDNAIVGTGWSIVTGGKTIYLSVIGDLNGDGRISATDITILRELVTKDITGTQDCILLSAIVLNKGGITTADSEVLRVVVNGILQINRY